MRARFAAVVSLSCLVISRAVKGQAPPPASKPSNPPPTTAPREAPAAPTGTAATARVRLLATGGTISNRAGGRLTAEDLVKSIPALSRYAVAEFEQFANT